MRAHRWLSDEELLIVLSHFDKESGTARPGNRLWCWIEQFLRVYLPDLVASGALREEECAAHWEEWQANARDPQASISSPPMVGVIGVKV